MEKILTILALGTLSLSLVGCDTTEGEPEAPAPAPPTEVSSTMIPAPGTPPLPTEEAEASVEDSIDAQISELHENNGNLSQEDRDTLNNVPVVPDVFDQ